MAQWHLISAANSNYFTVWNSDCWIFPWRWLNHRGDCGEAPSRCQAPESMVQPRISSPFCNIVLCLCVLRLYYLQVVQLQQQFLWSREQGSVFWDKNPGCCFQPVSSLHCTGSYELGDSVLCGHSKSENSDVCGTQGAVLLPSYWAKQCLQRPLHFSFPCCNTQSSLLDFSIAKFIDDTQAHAFTSESWKCGWKLPPPFRHLNKMPAFRETFWKPRTLSLVTDCWDLLSVWFHKWPRIRRKEFLFLEMEEFAL